MAIKKIIALGSAKGGVGKSSITASLAISLSKSYKVGVLDADIYGPNQNILFNIDKKPEQVDELIIPIIKNNIKILSIGNILPIDEAAIWRGPRLSGAIKKLIQCANWGDLDYLLIDMPPGTGDAYLTVFNELNVDHFILITNDNKLANADLYKTFYMLKKLDINILGYVKNNILNITNESEDNFFKTNNIDLLGTFSFDKKIYNFDIDYNSDISNKLSKVIDKKVNE